MIEDVKLRGIRFCYIAMAMSPGCCLLVWGVLQTDLIEILSWCMVFAFASLLVVIPRLWKHPHLRRLALCGFVAGMAGTAAYTLFRWPVAYFGVVPDVPLIIGDHLWGVKDIYWDRCWQSALLGYGFHFIFTGAMWGSAYAMLDMSNVRWSGLCFGVLIGGVFLLSPLFGASLTYGYRGTVYHIVIIVLMAHMVYGFSVHSVLVLLIRTGNEGRVVQANAVLPSVAAPDCHVSQDHCIGSARVE